MDKKDEMERVARVFDNYELTKTADAIRSLSNELYEKNIQVDFDEAYSRIRDMLRDEFVSKPGTIRSFKENCYRAYTSLLIGAVRKDTPQVKKLFEDFEPSMKRLANSYKIISEVAQGLMGSQQLTHKQRYFGACFGYMIIVESVFKELCEIIFMLDGIRKRRPKNFSKVEAMDIFKLTQKIKSKADLSVLVEGYWNLLRNSIAHANFEYNETTGKMNFKDIYHGKVTDLGDFTLDEFATKFYLKVDDLYILISSVLMLGRLVDIYQD